MPYDPDRFLPLVQVLTMGGTISAALRDQDGYSPALGGDEIIEGLPLAKIAEVRVEEFSRSLSFSVTHKLVGKLVDRLAQLLADSAVSGAVVTHGTAVMEEVAYLCDLTLDTAKPVVFTGATYHATDPGRDGPHNVLDAIRVAASPKAIGQGVLVCFGGEVHAARDVIKLHKFSPTAFVSPSGPLGFVDPTDLTFCRSSSCRITLRFPLSPFPRVEVIKAVMDMDELLLRAALDAPVAGIVLEGFPGAGGMPPSALIPVREALERKIPVVLTSRSPFGITTPTAAGESGPKVLEKMGVIIGGDLPAHKARLLLMVALGNKQDMEEIRATFAEVARGGTIA